MYMCRKWLILAIHPSDVVFMQGTVKNAKNKPYLLKFLPQWEVQQPDLYHEETDNYLRENWSAADSFAAQLKSRSFVPFDRIGRDRGTGNRAWTPGGGYYNYCSQQKELPKARGVILILMNQWESMTGGNLPITGLEISNLNHEPNRIDMTCHEGK